MSVVWTIVWSFSWTAWVRSEQTCCWCCFWAATGRLLLLCCTSWVLPVLCWASPSGPGPATTMCHGVTVPRIQMSAEGSFRQVHRAWSSHKHPMEHFSAKKHPGPGPGHHYMPWRHCSVEFRRRQVPRVVFCPVHRVWPSHKYPIQNSKHFWVLAPPPCVVWWHHWK